MTAAEICILDARKGEAMKFREEWVIAGALISLVVGIGTIIVMFLVIMQEPEAVFLKAGHLMSRTESAPPSDGGRRPEYELLRVQRNAS